LVAAGVASLERNGSNRDRRQTRQSPEDREHARQPTIFTNPNAHLLFGGLHRGLLCAGLFPSSGRSCSTRRNLLSIAGVVIEALRSVEVLHMTVSRLLPRMASGLDAVGCDAGRAATGAVAMGPQWKLQALRLLFMGWGFYMITAAAGVCQRALRGSGRHACRCIRFLFHGETAWRHRYGFGIQHAARSTLLTAAAIMVALGIVCAPAVGERRPADARRASGGTAECVVRRLKKCQDVFD